eukprot:XP_008185723.1 PREDICTED: putative uncharacterized protein FLJ37770 [Acyrthosiphon pisum]
MYYILLECERMFDNDCLSKPRVYEWASRFASGRESTQDDARSGAPKIVHTKQNVERFSVLVRTNRRLTVRMMSSELGINKETVRQMLHGDLLMPKMVGSDRAPLDFWLFPKLKEPMKGHHYEDFEDIKRAVTMVLKSLTSGDFQECFQKWEERWTKCVRLRGEYSESMGA